MGSAAKPREVMTSDVARVDDSPVVIARRVIGSTVVWANVRVAEGEEGDGGWIDVGDRKNSNDHVFDAVPSLCLEPFLRISMIRVCWRVREKPDGGARRSAGRGTMDTSGRFIISLNSLVANAASRGPRRPMIATCFTAERESTSRTGCGTSN